MDSNFNHAQKDHEDRVRAAIVCPYCGKTFDSKKGYTAHEAYHHAPEKLMFPCTHEVSSKPHFPTQTMGKLILFARVARGGSGRTASW